ncbi:22936_t:CDS:2, partial [Racocetra persica]
MPLTADTKNWFHNAINNYKLKEISYDDLGKLEFIDHGGFGNVYWTSCNSIRSEKVAVKEIYIKRDEDENQIKTFLNESSFTSTNYPILWNKFNHDEGYNHGAYYLLMEYAEGGTLREYLKTVVNTAKHSWKKKIKLA